MTKPVPRSVVEGFYKALASADFDALAPYLADDDVGGDRCVHRLQQIERAHRPRCDETVGPARQHAVGVR